MSNNNKPSVRPKRWTETSNSSTARPQTVSKDAALAHQLMQEDLQNVCSNDEKLAKELQNQLNEITDEEEARQIVHVEKRRPLRENYNFTRRNRNPFLRTGLRPISDRFQEMNMWQQVDNNESDDDLLECIRISEIADSQADNSENSENNTNSSGAVVFDSAENNRRPHRYYGWLGDRRRPSDRSALNTSQRSSLNSSSRNRPSQSSHPSTFNNTSQSSNAINTQSRRAPFPLGLRHRNVRTIASNDASSAASEDDLDINDVVSLNRLSNSDSRAESSSASASSDPLSGELEPEDLLLNMTIGGPEFINILRDPMMLIGMLLTRAPSLLVPDDIDLTDYDALWDLAERNGEVKSKGLSEKDIEKLPLKIHRVKNKSKHPSDCRICLTEYSYGDKIRELPCSHSFHRDCVDEWFKRNGSCPICREEIKPT